MNQNSKIPKFPHKFFKWYCKPDKYEEIHGDLEEFYYERIEEMGSTKARFYYLLDIIRCCQPYAWRKPKSQINSNIIMFKNYYKTSIRSLMKHPVGTFINIFGLSVAIGICIVVYAFIDVDLSKDAFHENKQEVYLATFRVDRDGNEEQYGTSPRPLGKLLKQDFTQIKDMCRIDDARVIVKFENNVFHETVRFVDPAFLDMFTFPLKWGAKSNLSDLNSIILSEEMSIKYFGFENPIGKNLQLRVGENEVKTFSVQGVAEPFPIAHIIDFDFLIHYDNQKVFDPKFNVDDWDQFVSATFIHVTDPLDLHMIEQGMDKYKKLQNAMQNDWAISSFSFEQLDGLHLRSGNIRDGITYDNSGPGRAFLPILGFFMLALASFNYINLAIVSSAKRLKEIGMRKVMGADRRKVIVQFLSENILITFFALVIGVILGAFLFMPWFTEQSSRQLYLDPYDPMLWLFLLGLLLFTGIASGIYPALYISKFQVVKIFKGTVRFGQKNRLTKIFLGLQMILACMLITTAVMFTWNNTYQNNQSWGYNYKDVLYAKIPDKQSFDQLYDALNQDPNIKSIAGSEHHIGKAMVTTVINVPDRQYEVKQISIDANYLETLGLPIKEGRGFLEHHKSEKKSVIINELLADKMGLEEPVGHQFKINDEQYEVVGVSNDFHFYSFSFEKLPSVFLVADEKNYQYITIQANPGTQQETYLALLEHWATLFPETPFEGGYQEDVWGRFYSQIASWERFNKAIAFIAVLLASLGLYGLVSLNVAGRIKEFSIRKTLGAGLKNISASIISQYVLLSVIAFVIAAPLSQMYVQSQLDSVFAYPLPASYSGVAVAVSILASVLLFVIGTQIAKVVRSNPANGLRVD